MRQLDAARQWYGGLPVHARLVSTALFAAIAALLLIVALRGLGWYLDGSERLADSEPRYARLQGYIHSVDALRDSSAAIDQALDGLTYSADRDVAATGAAAQQQLRRLLESAGMAVSGSQVLSPEEHEGFQEIRMDLEASGSMAALEQALIALREARPLVFVQSLQVTPVRTRSRNAPDEQNIALSLNVSVVKLQ